VVSVSGNETAERIIEREVRELVRRRGLDPGNGGAAAVRSLIDEVVADYGERGLTASMPPLEEPEQVARAVADRVVGLGPLQPYLDDPAVEEIWVNQPDKVFVAKAGRPVLTSTVLSEQQVRDLVELMLRASGRRLDLSSPFVDATLADGSRLHVVIPDITPRHWAINVRKFVVRERSLDELVRLGTMTPQCASFLVASVIAGLNIVVVGATQTGKTTLLSALASAIPARERVITCEEAQVRYTRSKSTVKNRSRSVRRFESWAGFTADGNTSIQAVHQGSWSTPGSRGCVWLPLNGSALQGRSRSGDRGRCGLSHGRPGPPPLRETHHHQGSGGPSALEDGETMRMSKTSGRPHPHAAGRKRTRR
jgi:hypothetical protein